LGNSLTLHFAVIIVHGRTVEYRLDTKSLILAPSVLIGDDSTVEIPWSFKMVFSIHATKKDTTELLMGHTKLMLFFSVRTGEDDMG
jgi:hypothetical protein